MLTPVVNRPSGETGSSTGSGIAPVEVGYRRRILRSRAMYRFASALPFFSRPPLRFFERFREVPERDRVDLAELRDFLRRPGRRDGDRVEREVPIPPSCASCTRVAAVTSPMWGTTPGLTGILRCSRC